MTENLKPQRKTYLKLNEIESEPVKREDEENKQFLKNMKNNEDSNGIESNVKDEENDQIDRKIKNATKSEEIQNKKKQRPPWTLEKTLDLGKSLPN